MPSLPSFQPKRRGWPLFSALVLTIASASALNAQPWLSFERSYEARATMQAVRPLGDSGFVAVGRILDSVSTSSAKIWRLDQHGVPRWSREFSGRGSASFQDVLVLPDGFVAVGSNSLADGSAQQAWQMRFALNGDTLWTTELAFTAGSAFEAITANASGWWSAGRAALPGDLPDVLLSAFASDGSEIWSALYGSASLEQAFDLARHADGDPAMAGRLFDGFRDRVYGVRAEPSSGAADWTRSYSNGASDLGLGIAVQPDGAAVLCGGSFLGGNQQGVLIGLDPAGEVDWQGEYGGPMDDRLHAIQGSPDAALFAAGRYRGNADFQPWSLRTDSMGQEIWQVRDSLFNGTWEDLAFAGDGGIVLAGTGALADGFGGSLGPEQARLARRGANGQSCPAVDTLTGTVDGSALTLMWPEVDGATAYTVLWNNGTWSMDSSRSTAATTLLLEGLMPEEEHVFSVHAFCGDLVYGLSAEAAFSVEEEDSTGVGIAAVEASASWRLSPNPARDFAAITAPGAFPQAEQQSLQWRLYDLQGRLLNSGSLAQRIPTADLPAGPYRVELVLPEGQKRVAYGSRSLVKVQP